MGLLSIESRAEDHEALVQCANAVTKVWNEDLPGLGQRYDLARQFKLFLSTENVPLCCADGEHLLNLYFSTPAGIFKRVAATLVVVTRSVA
jgi:hypothetical protein